MRENFEILERAIQRFEKNYGEGELASLADRVANRLFAEVLLQGMIRANPPAPADELSDVQRLSVAFSAIFGCLPDRRAHEQDDYADLYWMQMRYRDQNYEVETGKRSKIDSNTALAEWRAGDDLAKVNRLREKFPKFRRENEGMDADKNDDVEVIRRLSLELIQDIVTKLGMPFYAYD